MKYYYKESLKGSITLEAALIMPMIIILVISIIKWGYELHDKTLISMLDKYGAVKARIIDWSYYNVEDRHVDVEQLVNKPLIDISGAYKKHQYDILNKLIAEYEEKLILNGDYLQAVKQYSNGLKNSTIVRTTHILIEHAGRIKYD